MPAMARCHHGLEIRPIQRRSTEAGNFRVKYIVEEDVLVFKIPVHNPIGMNRRTRIGDLLTSSMSLLETDIAFVLSKIREYALIPGQFKSYPGLGWSEILKEPFVFPLVACNAHRFLFQS